MGIRVALHHKTIYEYDRMVALGPQIVRLRPAPHSRTAVLSYSLRVGPEEHFINWQQDPHGNFLARLVFPEPTRYFSLEVDLVAEMAVINPFDFFLEPYAEKYPFRYEALEQRELGSYLDALPAGPHLKDFLASIDDHEIAIIDFLVNLNQRLQHEIRYVIRMEPGVQSAEETLELASGSCRDSAWLLVQILRHLGLAARFVSGYLIQLKPDVKPLGRPRGSGGGLLRPARLGRGLPARGRLDRSGPHIGAAGGRRTYSAGGNSGTCIGVAGLRLGGSVRGGVSPRDAGDPHS